MSDIPDQRLLLVHAHPDDETIGTGATMAKYVAEGRGVTLVTCTGGEMGEILVPELEHLAADRDDGLAEHRAASSTRRWRRSASPTTASSAGSARYRDSGMEWHEDGHAIPATGDDVHDNAFWNADLTEAADHLVDGDPRGAAAGAGHLRPVRRLRPPRPHPGPPGGDVRRHAGRGAVVPPRPRRALGDRQDLLDRDVREPDARQPAAAAGGRRHHVVRAAWTPTAPRPMATPDERLSRRIDATDYVDQKMAALRAHRTQIAVDGPFFALSNSGHRAGARSTSGSPRGSRVRPAPTGSRTTCSPGSDDAGRSARCAHSARS